MYTEKLGIKGKICIKYTKFLGFLRDAAHLYKKLSFDMQKKDNKKNYARIE